MRPIIAMIALGRVATLMPSFAGVPVAHYNGAGKHRPVENPNKTWNDSKPADQGEASTNAGSGPITTEVVRAVSPPSRHENSYCPSGKGPTRISSAVSI